MPVKTCSKTISATSFIVLALLAGCATPESRLAKVGAEDDATLCINWILQEGGRKYESLRVTEMTKRNLDCRQYVELAKARAESRAASAAQSNLAAQQLLNSSSQFFQAGSPQPLVAPTLLPPQPQVRCTTRWNPLTKTYISQCQ